MTETDANAIILWDYLQLHEQPVKSDVIFCLCSSDVRVAERAAQLMLSGLGDWLVFSGGFGALTKDIFAKPEADTFADVAIKMGVPASKIIIENKSTNTGENIQFTFSLLKDRAVKADSLLLVQKPYMERRTYATFKKQWPESGAAISVTSPQMTYDEYMQGEDKDKIINVMVGDMQRIAEYPKRGFQIEQAIPDDVWTAYETLVSLGFTKRLI